MTRWHAPARTPEARQIYAAAEGDRMEHPDKYRLGTEAVDFVIDRASRGDGEKSLGPVAQWKPALSRYLESAAEDGRLNALGARNLQNTAVGRLRARTALDAYACERPDLDRQQLIPPIIITGGWRTGTTFLFRLLGRDPRFRVPLPTELSVPWRLPGDLTPQERADRLAEAAAGHRMLHVLNPTMAAVHDSGPDLAEECGLGGQPVRDLSIDLQR